MVLHSDTRSFLPKLYASSDTGSRNPPILRAGPRVRIPAVSPVAILARARATDPFGAPRMPSLTGSSDPSLSLLPRVPPRPQRARVPSVDPLLASCHSTMTRIPCAPTPPIVPLADSRCLACESGAIPFLSILFVSRYRSPPCHPTGGRATTCMASKGSSSSIVCFGNVRCSVSVKLHVDTT